MFQNTLRQWNIVFNSIALVGAIGIFTFLFFGSTERQEWNGKINDEDEDRAALLEEPPGVQQTEEACAW